jgi:hypothetical protein
LVLVQLLFSSATLVILSRTWDLDFRLKVPKATSGVPSIWLVEPVAITIDPFNEAPVWHVAQTVLLSLDATVTVLLWQTLQLIVVDVFGSPWAAPVAPDAASLPVVPLKILL